MRLVVIGACVVIGVPLYKLIISLTRLANKTTETMEQLEKPIQNTQLLITRMHSIVDQLEKPVQSTEQVLQDTRVLAIKLQTAADQWTHLVETVELVPVRKKVKQILKLPFLCCGDAYKNN